MSDVIISEEDMIEVSSELLLGPMSGFVIAVTLVYFGSKKIDAMQKSMMDHYDQQLEAKDKQIDDYHHKYLSLLEKITRSTNL